MSRMKLTYWWALSKLAMRSNHVYTQEFLQGCELKLRGTLDAHGVWLNSQNSPNEEQSKKSKTGQPPSTKTQM